MTVIQKMMTERHHKVKQQIEIQRAPHELWQLLTEPENLKQWFADVERADASGAINLSFGDGDFFSARLETFNAPHHLGIVWKFMGLGPSYEINFFLGANDRGTRLDVEDAGALTIEEAASLTCGWQDFLERLQRFASTGENSRYQWSREISITADLGSEKDPSESLCFLDDNRSRYFPVSTVNRLRNETVFSSWSFTEKHWAGETTVTASLQESGSKNYLTVTHEGWEAALPSPENVAARRRYAQMWRELLLQLEREFVSKKASPNSG